MSAGDGKAGAASDQTSFLTNFAPLALVDQAGRPFRVDSLRGKVVLFNFIFTSGGRLMQRYAGDPPEVPRLVRELDTLVKLTN